MNRKPADPGTAMAEGMDHLLRRFRALDTAYEPPAALVDPGNVDRKLDRTFTVAAFNADPSVRAFADYVCDGVDDEAEIIAAFTRLGTRRGMVALSSGTFYVDTSAGDVQINIPTRCVLEGAGNATIIEFNYLGGIINFRMAFQSKVRELAIVQEFCGC